MISEKQKVGVISGFLLFLFLSLPAQAKEAQIVCLTLGMAYDKKGQPLTAIEYYSKAIQLNPALKEAYYNRAVLYQVLKLHGLALEDYKKLVDLGFSNAEFFYVHRGNVHKFHAHLDEALLDYNKAIELDGKFGEAFAARAFIHFVFGAYEESGDDVRMAKALDFRPDALLLENLGRISAGARSVS